MSEKINNREYRQKVLKEIILELHKGKTVEEVKPRFEKLIQGVSASEIAEMEQALIMEGMPVEQIQNLCDVHAAVFKGSIEDIHRVTKPEETPGHPVHTFLLENRAIEKLVEEKVNPAIEKFKTEPSESNKKALLGLIDELLNIDKHYLRKENLLFPYMERYGITAPPKVMWGVDDEIRDALKEAKRELENKNDTDKLTQALNSLAEMIFKEENILFPMVLETLSEDEWYKIYLESDGIGYTLIGKPAVWKPERQNVEKKEIESGKEPASDNYIKFDAGVLTPEEINALMNTLPFDITFVDKDGLVKFFTQGKERIFPRPKTIIGRHVTNCHPPASVHIVEKIVEDLKSGKKDHEDFWIKKDNAYIFIRYFAVRNSKGEYIGTIEVTQDIKPIQEITGEKRLVSE